MHKAKRSPGLQVPRPYFGPEAGGLKPETSNLEPEA